MGLLRMRILSKEIFPKCNGLEISLFLSANIYILGIKVYNIHL